MKPSEIKRHDTDTLILGTGGAHFREDCPDPGGMEDSDFTVAQLKDGTVNVTREPVDFGLVLLLAVHLFGGLRLVALEWLPWTMQQKTLAALAVAALFFIAVLFILRAI